MEAARAGDGVEMSLMHDIRLNEIDACLRKLVPLVERVEGQQWELVFTNSHAQYATARLDEDWLLLDAPLGANAGGFAPGKLLAWNGRLSGNSKYALAPGGATHLRAEIPLLEGVQLRNRLGGACLGFQEALRLLEGEADAVAASDAAGSETASDLISLMADSGWPFTERSAGRLAVPLEARQGFFQAMVEAGAGSAVRVSLDLVRWEEPSPQSRQALSVLLLTACGALRLARAVAEEADSRTSAWFEVRFSEAPEVAELACALAALSVAPRRCGREAAQPEDDRIAKQ